jgi:hypothetical protein
MSAVPQVVTSSTDEYAELLARGLAGPNILLNGESGVGKTYSLGTLVDWAQAHGKEVFYLDLENSLETLLGFWRTPIAGEPKPIPPCLHWHQTQTPPVSLKQMLQAALDTGDLSYEMLTQKKDTSRGGTNNHYWKILGACADFPDDRTGKKFGPVDKFGADRVFITDSFTELSNAAAKMIIGAKPTMAPPEYGVAQNHLMNFLRLCTHGTPCTFVLTSHPVRDKDEISGMVRTTIKTVGTAIQPEIPPLFSDVIYAVREGDKFYWDTAAYGVVTKTRSLGYRSRIEPNFGQIMDLWAKRGGK